MPPDTWIQRTPTGSAESLARELGLPEAVARLLASRGFATADVAREFLHPSLDQLHDPLLMLGMSAAVARLKSAIFAREPILIYGDYDVDGTVATVLLKTAIERAAVAIGTSADVRYHIPHRIREGYGMQETRIEEAAAEGVRLVISVDTGIRAFRAADEAKRVGLDLIVTDHHLPDGVAGIPDAVAVVNPNQPGCPYPYKELCGAAVAFKLAQALLESVVPEPQRETLRSKTLPSFLKLLCVATIADSVPLTGENRVIAALGLIELRKPSQPGLRALLELAQIDTTRPIAASDVGFRLAPRINAAGRMDIASDVVDLFLTKDPALAQTLAQKLHRLNDDRRATEAEALRAIEAQIDALAAAGELPACLVLDDGPTYSLTAHLTTDLSSRPESALSADAAERPAGGTTTNSSPQPTTDLSSRPESALSADVAERTAVAQPLNPWHRGVIGILASRVVDRTARPALVMTHEDGVAYGSGRSIHGFHLLDALTAAHGADTLLTRFGGHAYAVGFALPSPSVPLLRERMILCATKAAESTPTTIVEIEYDAELRLGEITPDFLTGLEQLSPFGMANTEPLFISRGVRLCKLPVAVKERHLRVSVEDPDDGSSLGGMAWGRRINWAERAQAEGWQQGDFMDIAYRLCENRHPDFGGWEMEILSLRRSHLAE